ncbi:MAG: hypothetical protein WAK69_20705 [Rhodoplanes sp.]
MSRYTDEEKAAIMAEARNNLALADKLLAERHAPLNVLPFVPRKEPEPEPERRKYTDSVVDRLICGVREETAGQFATLRAEIEADVGELYGYVAGELSEILTTTFNTVADEFEAVHTTKKAIETDILNLQSEVAVLRADMDALRSLVEKPRKRGRGAAR